jgi:hypothetical protein
MMYTDTWTKAPKQSSSTGLTARRNSKDRLVGQLIQISYKMTKERPFTPSGLAKKRTLEQEFYEK